MSQRHRSRVIDMHYLIVHGQVDGLRGRKIAGPLKTGIDEDTVYVRIQFRHTGLAVVSSMDRLVSPRNMKGMTYSVTN